MTHCDFTTKRLNIPTDSGQFTGFRVIHDNVNSPSHYQGINGLEVIEVHKNFLTEEELRGYYKGNALKYLLRERKKNGLEDLKKARKHLDWLIELEGKNGN